jgi:hypothetical protein
MLNETTETVIYRHILVGIQFDFAPSFLAFSVVCTHRICRALKLTFQLDGMFGYRKTSAILTLRNVEFLYEPSYNDHELDKWRDLYYNT